MVQRFVSALEITNQNAYIFAVATCGGAVFGVLGRLAQLLEHKGVRLSYGKNLVSVTNYIPEYKAKDSEKLRLKINAGINSIADAVNSRESNRIGATTFLNNQIYKSYPAVDSDRSFTISPECTGCGTCQSMCPAQNIAMQAGKPDFEHKCEHCLACLQNCPAAALDWNGKTQGKARYRNSEISLSELISFNSF